MGKECKFINKGTDDEKCARVASSDLISPIITPLTEILSKNYTLSELSSNNGFEIKPDVKPYTPITFGVRTNEIAKCKIGEELGKDYDEIPNYIGDDSTYKTEHNVTYRALPGGKEYLYYIRCTDFQGNKNIRDYTIKFKLSPEPDRTAPVIVEIEPENNAFISSGANELNVEFLVNEPADCKFDEKKGVLFNMMPGNLSCEDELTDADDGLFSCVGTLTGLVQEKNMFYFKCKDKLGNAMQQDYEYKLQGTNKLVIVSSEPSGDVYEKEFELKAETSSDSECYYDGIRFFETGGKVHKQKLSPPWGNYVYEIECEDKAGNTVKKDVEFSVKVDKKAPKIAEVYEIVIEEGRGLHITTDEDSICEYSNAVFNFGSGKRMPIDWTKGHDSITEESVYYVTCEDKFGNRMPLVRIFV